MRPITLLFAFAVLLVSGLSEAQVWEDESISFRSASTRPESLRRRFRGQTPACVLPAQLAPVTTEATGKESVPTGTARPKPGSYDMSICCPVAEKHPKVPPTFTSCGMADPADSVVGIVINLDDFTTSSGTTLQDAPNWQIKFDDLSQGPNYVLIASGLLTGDASTSAFEVKSGEPDCDLSKECDCTRSKKKTVKKQAVVADKVTIHGKDITPGRIVKQGQTLRVKGSARDAERVRALLIPLYVDKPTAYVGKVVKDKADKKDSAFDFEFAFDTNPKKGALAEGAYVLRVFAWPAYEQIDHRLIHIRAK